MELVTETERLGNGTCVVAVAGEVDLYTETELEEALLGVLDNGATALTVDLSECALIGSAGLRVLVRAHKRLANSGSGLALVSANPALLKVFEVTRLDDVFEIYASPAVASNGDCHG